jgi:hypothetical protein
MLDLLKSYCSLMQTQEQKNIRLAIDKVSCFGKRLNMATDGGLNSYKFIKT